MNADTDDDDVPDDLDMDPLVDLTITVKITEILALDDVDDTNDADFYFWIYCSDGHSPQFAKLPDRNDHDYFELDSDHVNPDSSVTLNVADDSELVGFMIILFDDDGGLDRTLDDTMASGDDPCDISSRPGGGGGDPNNWGYSALLLNYDLKTGQWSGEDSPGDTNGYGHASGAEDGSENPDTDQDDCELWFDITQGGVGDDGDGLTWWQEVREGAPLQPAYGTDPTDPSSPGWVGYYVDTELFSELQSGSPDLRTYSLRIGEYAEVGTKVICGDWTTAEGLKADLKINYNNGMVGAVLVGDMPMAFESIDGHLISLFYEDMDGAWTQNSNGLYEIRSIDVEQARGNAPEIYVGLLRPPASKNDISGMSEYLTNYFTRALSFINEAWIGTNRALLIEADFSDLDPTQIKEELNAVYNQFYTVNFEDNRYSSHFINPSEGTSTAINLLSRQYQPPPFNNHYSFCVISGHSDEKGVFVSASPVISITPSDIIELKITTPFTLMTCCRTTRFINADGSETGPPGYYYLAGYFAFNKNGWGLGTFGYSGVAGGGVPGLQGFTSSLNQGKTIGESILEWGYCWSQLENPLGPYSLSGGSSGIGNNYEHYYLNYIGDPLLKS